MIGQLAERYVSLKAQWLFFLQNPTGCDWIDIFQILGIGLAVAWSARASFFALQTHRLQALLARSGPVADRDKQKVEVARERIRKGMRELAGTRATAAIEQHRPIRLYDHDDELLLCNVGFLRPRVLVSRGVVRLLDDEELAAGLAHELAHVVRRDNLKRAVAGGGVLRSTRPDLVGRCAAAGGLTREVVPLRSGAGAERGTRAPHAADAATRPLAGTAL